MRKKKSVKNKKGEEREEEQGEDEEAVCRKSDMGDLDWLLLLHLLGLHQSEARGHLLCD